MTTLFGAVELLRGRGQLPTSKTISVRDLQQRFQPRPAGSMRALLSKMLGSVSAKRPWAVILCRFQGSQPDPLLEGPIEQFYRDAFTPGSGGFVEYWRDASLGAIDISGSRVFGWTTVAIPRNKAGIGTPKAPGPGRGGLANAAVNAVKRDVGPNALNGFLGPIAIYTQNWSIDGVPADATWQNSPELYPFWIDGSADSTGKVTVTPPHGGTPTAHEMGHVFGMQHDVGSDLRIHYADPSCIMSQNGSFLHPKWNRAFGPAVCFPHLMQRDWMYKRRVYYDDGAWLSQAEGITLPLAPITRPSARANLGIKLAYKQGAATWDYYLEYMIPTEWNRGVPGAPYLFVRRIAPRAANGADTPAYLTYIEVPPSVGQTAETVEPSGNVRFRVELTNLRGPVLFVSAKKL